MSIDANQPALPGQTKGHNFKATRVACYSDGQGSKLQRKLDSELKAASWTEASDKAPEVLTSEHGRPEEDEEAANMGLDLVSVTVKVVAP